MWWCQKPPFLAWWYRRLGVLGHLGLRAPWVQLELMGQLGLMELQVLSDQRDHKGSQGQPVALRDLWAQPDLKVSLAQLELMALQVLMGLQALSDQRVHRVSLAQLEVLRGPWAQPDQRDLKASLAQPVLMVLMELKAQLGLMELQVLSDQRAHRVTLAQLGLKASRVSRETQAQQVLMELKAQPVLMEPRGLKGPSDQRARKVPQVLEVVWRFHYLTKTWWHLSLQHHTCSHAQRHLLLPQLPMGTCTFLSMVLPTQSGMRYGQATFIFRLTRATHLKRSQI